jgi:hypothetical protein
VNRDPSHVQFRQINHRTLLRATSLWGERDRTLLRGEERNVLSRVFVRTDFSVYQLSLVVSDEGSSCIRLQIDETASLEGEHERSVCLFADEVVQSVRICSDYFLPDSERDEACETFASLAFEFGSGAITLHASQDFLSAWEVVGAER